MRLRPIAEAVEALEAALTPVCAMLDSLPLQIKRDCSELSHLIIGQPFDKSSILKNTRFVLKAGF